MYIRRLVHLVGGDLVGDIEEGGDSSGHRFYGVVDLVRSTFAIGLMLEVSNGFKGSIGVNFGSGALVVKDTCTKAFRLSSTMSGRLS
jgi:hypothetical protein